MNCRNEEFVFATDMGATCMRGCICACIYTVIYERFTTAKLLTKAYFYNIKIATFAFISVNILLSCRSYAFFSSNLPIPWKILL